MIVANQVNGVNPVAAVSYGTSAVSAEEVSRRPVVASPPVAPVSIADKKPKAPVSGLAAEAVDSAAPAEEITEEQLSSALKVVEQALDVSYSYVKIRFDEKAGRYQISKVDQETQEVIREIPPEKLLKIAAMIKERIAEALGFLVDEKI
jgi:uncharacterized FlaG/YvyC family protein